MAAQPATRPLFASYEGTAWIECPSDLVRGKEQQLLSVALPLIEQNDLTIDMSRVHSLDAAGIGTLVYLLQCAERNENQLLLVNASPRVHELLSIVHLDSLLFVQSLPA